MVACSLNFELYFGTVAAVADAGTRGASGAASTEELVLDAGASTSLDVTVIADAVDAATTQATLCKVGLRPSSQMRLLTHRQYDRTVRDLLGVEQLNEFDNHPPSWLLAPDSDVEVTQLGWDAYQAAARAIAEQVMTQSELRGHFVSCDLKERDSCLLATVTHFGRRAFRRPLAESEVDEFEQLLAVGSELPAEDAAQILLEAFLISPSFLVRAELNQEQTAPGVFALSNHEVAARLSYLLWGSMPDEQLDSAADAGDLITSAGVLTQARRMLGDDKARNMIADFVEHYLHLEPDGPWNATKDQTLFPEYTASVRAAMALETQLFFQEVVLGGGSVADLVQSPMAFVNVATAPLYGLPAADFGQELERIELPERPGFLSRVGFLSAYSSFDNTSPIRRGAFVAGMLGPLPAPPPGAASTPLPAQKEGTTMRARVEQQTSEQSCSSCHESINPPGFVLETFDAVGRKQTVERETGAPIDTLVEWSLDGETRSIATVGELMQALAESNQVRTEYARRWVSFAFELDEVDGSDCTVRTLSQALARDGYTQLDLIADLTQTPQFLSRTQETP